MITKKQLKEEIESLKLEIKETKKILNLIISKI